MTTTHHPGEAIDVAGYTYILWDRAPAVGSWHATREGQNGTVAVVVRKVSERGVQRWKIMGQAHDFHAPSAALVNPTTAKAIARASDPVTSKAAAVAAAPRTGTQKAALLDAYARSPRIGAVGMDHAIGLTDAEAAEVCGLLHTGYWKRCSDLRNAGFISPVTHPSGNVVVRYTSNGDANMVCAITESGLAALPPALEPNVRQPEYVHSICVTCGGADAVHYPDCEQLSDVDSVRISPTVDSVCGTCGYFDGIHAFTCEEYG